jgi:aubergine
VYQKLKYFLQTECHVVSQIVLKETINKKGDIQSIVKNIIVQISAKIGDTPWKVLDLPLTDGGAMFIGIDVCHRIGKNEKSVLGLVASLNKGVTNYYSDSVFHNRGEEISVSLLKCFKGALLAFFKQNKLFPSRIFVYRDAVSQGQVEHVYRTEIEQLENAIEISKKELEISQDTKILFILANKRIEQRFFTEQKGKLYNPSHGIVIEEGITRSDRFEFYMISHSGPTGLQCPVRYEVMYDTMKDYKRFDLYVLTNKLCYLFYNFHGPVKVPAPIMYAHTLCDYISRICQDKDEIASIPPNFIGKLFFI